MVGLEVVFGGLMKRTCLLGVRRPGWNLDDGRWPGFSSMKVKGRDIWTVLNADADRVGSDTVRLDRGGLMLRFGVAISSMLVEFSSFAFGVAGLTGIMCAGTGGGEGELRASDRLSDSATLESGGEKKSSSTELGRSLQSDSSDFLLGRYCIHFGIGFVLLRRKAGSPTGSCIET